MKKWIALIQQQLKSRLGINPKETAISFLWRVRGEELL